MNQHPKHCDIPHCQSLYLGENANGEAIRKRGNADFYVNDRLGIERGICQIHYLEGLVAAGKAPNQELLDRDGRYDTVKVRERWDAIAQQDLLETQKRIDDGRMDRRDR